MATLKIKKEDGTWAFVETAEAVKYTEQILTNEQKIQAKNNIGVTEDLTALKSYIDNKSVTKSDTIKDSDTDSTYMTIHYAGEGLESTNWVAAWNPDDPTQIKAIEPSKLLKGYVPKEVVVADGVDLNTVLESGFYRLSADHVNAPDNLDVNYGNMIVSRGADTALQIVTPYSGAARLCYRSGVVKNGAFVNVTNWRHILDNETYSPYSYPLAETNVCKYYCVDGYIAYTINMRTFNGVIYLDVMLEDAWAGATVGGSNFKDYATNPVSIPMSGVTQVQNYLNLAKHYITNSNAANLAWKGCSNAGGILIEATLTASSLEIKLFHSPNGNMPEVEVYEARTTITLVPTLI